MLCEKVEVDSCSLREEPGLCACVPSGRDRVAVVALVGMDSWQRCLSLKLESGTGRPLLLHDT